KCCCVFGICSRPAAFISCSIPGAPLWKRRSMTARQNCTTCKPHLSNVLNGFAGRLRRPQVRKTFELLACVNGSVLKKLCDHSASPKIASYVEQRRSADRSGHTRAFDLPLRISVFSTGHSRENRDPHQSPD